MLYYLYYKLYKAVLRGSLKDIPEFIAPIYFGGLLGINIIVIHLLLVKMNVMPYLFTDIKQGSILMAVLIILALLYFRKEKRETIIQKYSNEPNSQRIKGNVWVSIYVGISFLAIFAVGLYKPGYLGR